jgi:cytochrome c oxidase assembly protein subunit 11
MAMSNRRVAALAGGLAVGMVGLAYASVPLYALFCQATGFGGTTQRADAAPEAKSTKTISVRFDGNTAASLPWDFHPEQATLQVKLGEEVMAHYSAVNHSAQSITGTAVFNVTPPQAGAYFSKIDCFCFTEQTLAPGKSADLPVVFFVDPAIADDPDAASITEITLSYTFYRAGDPQALSEAPAEKPKIN